MFEFLYGFVELGKEYIVFEMIDIYWNDFCD